MSTHDDDLDPTGMRALLRGLPDPGPMPDDLVRRILASLAEQPALLGDSLHERSADDGVSRGTSGNAPASWWVRHAGHAAVAAVVLLGGGALASSQLGLLDSQSNSETTAGSGGPDSAGNDESAEETPSAADAPGPSTQDSQADVTDERLRDAAPGVVVVRLSGRAYTAAGLTTQIDDPASAPTISPLTAEAPGIGPIGTELGVRSCLEALGLPRESAADVDLGAVDGTPAAVLVVTLGGERTAYAVGRDCTTSNPALLAGPVALP